MRDSSRIRRASSAALAAAAAFAAAAPALAAPAHVLFVVVDDLGFADLSYKAAMYNLTGPGGFATPTLDALALAGVRLESYYVHALCSPSRSAFLSGRYAYTTGMNAEVIVDGVPDQLATNIRTLADLLSGAGWATWAGGKWVSSRRAPGRGGAWRRARQRGGGGGFVPGHVARPPPWRRRYAAMPLRRYAAPRR